MIMNKLIVYEIYENEDIIFVSNLVERGYIILQNYVNLMIGLRNVKLNESFSYNVYIDYEVCNIIYQEVFIW